MVKTDGSQVLRRFLDTNGDNKVDQWCYFKDGIEIYRDIDANFNNKADQYRWLGTAGTRWGLDDDENGQIDSWKVISRRRSHRRSRRRAPRPRRRPLSAAAAHGRRPEVARPQPAASRRT